jgi:hypothetical protein
MDKRFLWKPSLSGLIDPQRASQSVETRRAPQLATRDVRFQVSSDKTARRTHVAELPNADIRLVIWGCRYDRLRCKRANSLRPSLLAASFGHLIDCKTSELLPGRELLECIEKLGHIGLSFGRPSAC